MIGLSLSHYRVLEEIGAGGMGVVYRAHDEQLDRDVAIKVLPPGLLAKDGSRARFRREALALARLDHPNVATIFEFGSQDGTDFLVTAYIPGITLDVKVGSRPLPPAEVLDLGIQFAKGLTAAHEQGVIHRDLKPGNLRLTPDGLLKILDFGLAHFDRVLEEPDTTTADFTESSQQITGTLPYMAPEQLRGERTDARSDIWSAGAVLYEMCTGQRPFPGKQGPLLIDSILNSQPRPPREVNQEISAGLENIVLKALDKDPGLRYQTANDLRIDLERLQAGSAPLARPRSTPKWPWIVAAALIVLLLITAFVIRRRFTITSRPVQRRSVAVLGFKNLGGKADADWISTSLAEMLTTELGAGGTLRTIPGENVARMKADLSIKDTESLGNDTLTKVYESLGSNLVVLGSYLDLGGQIRVDLRVQDTAAGETIATASETGNESQFFDLVKRIGESLRQRCGAGELSAEDRAATIAAEPANTEAARLYAEGLSRLREFDALAARDLLIKAVQADPKHAMAHAALAAAWSQLGYDGNAIAESKKAFDLSGNLPRKEKLSIEAQYRENASDWNKAVDIYHSLFVFFPDDLEFGLRLANTQISAGNGQDALATVQSLRKLPSPSGDDPRIDLAEAAAQGSLSDYQKEQAANQQAIAKAQRHGAQLLEAEAVLQQCWALRNTGSLEDAKSAGLQAKDTFAGRNDLRQEARSLTCVGDVLADQGKLSDAMGMHQQARDLANKIGAQKDIAGAHINLGNVLANQQKLKESTAQYRQALKVALEIGDKFDAQLAQNNIGVNLMLEFDFSGAAEMLSAAIQTSREIGDRSGVVTAEINLGTIFYNQGKLAIAESSLEDALSTARALGLKSSSALALVALGDLQLAQDKLEEAEKSYQESLAIRTQIGEQGGVANSQLALAGLEMARNQPSRAESLARQAAQEFENEKNGDQEAASYNVIAQALMAQGRAKDAQAELQRAARLPVSDKLVGLSLNITSARSLAADGKMSESLGKTSEVRAQAKQLKLPGYELEARLAAAEAQFKPARSAAVAELQAVQRDADQLGFKLTARKARAIHR